MANRDFVLLSIRKACVGDAARLTRLAMRAKAHWNYSESFLELCRSDLTVTEEYLSSAPAGVAEELDSGRELGFCGLSAAGQEPELVHAYVEPEVIGVGIGRQLWVWAVEQARAIGWKSFRIVSDPNARSFYERMGARLVGETPSPVMRDRLIPLLVYTI